MSGFSDLEFFVAVAEASSFSAAATRLGVSRSYASRVISSLEDRLGVRLFQRTTRRVELTRAGHLLLDEVGPLLEALDEAQARVSEAAQLVRGPLRISLPHAFGRQILDPPLMRFVQQHPEVELSLLYSEAKVDLVGGRFDLAIRGGAMEPSSLIARKLCEFRVLLLASPDYLASHGSPRSPAELSDHRCIRYLGNPQPDRWSFSRGDEEGCCTIRAVLETNSSDAAVQAARAGLGIARQPSFLAAHLVRSGELVSLLPEWTRGPEAFWLVYPNRSHLPVRLSLLLDFLLQEARQWRWEVGD